MRWFRACALLVGAAAAWSSAGAGRRARGARPARTARRAADGEPAATTVALTREAGKNDGLAAALAAVPALRAVEVPCVASARTPAMESELDAALLFADEPWDWVVVTSPEAAKTFDDAARRTGLFMMRDPRWCGFRVAAVGGATAAALGGSAAAGPWRDVFAPPTATAAALAAALPRDGARRLERVLFPASALAAPTLERGLEARGFAVTRVDAYTTEAAAWSDAAAAAARRADVVAVGSPSAARVWADRCGTTAAAACIGATSAEACRALGFADVFHPDKPGLAGWADAVGDAAKARAKAAA